MIKLYGDGRIQGLNLQESNVGNSSELVSLDNTVSSISSTVSSVSSNVSSLTTVVNEKASQKLFCLAYGSGDLDSSTTNGGVMTRNFSSLPFNQSGFSLSSGKIVLPETGNYLGFLTIESYLPNSTYAIRAGGGRITVNGSYIPWVGRYFKHVDQTFSNTHFTWGHNYVFSGSQGQEVGHTVDFYHNNSTSLSVSCTTTLFLTLL